MDAVPPDEFFAWAAGVGVGTDPNYPQSGCLRLLGADRRSRYWVRPDDPDVVAEFIAAAVDALGDWQGGYLWPRAGRWPVEEPPELHDGRVTNLQWAGVPSGRACAARVRPTERPQLIAALDRALLFGGDAADDLFFVPDHGRAVLWAGHHDALYLDTATPGEMRAAVEALAAAGYHLPTEPPDGTFRRPPWPDDLR